MMKRLLFLFLVVSFLLGCGMSEKKNEDVRFEYQGYGDSTLSVMFGTVFEDSSGIEKPIHDALVEIVETKKTTTSDLHGNFSIGEETGQYKVQVSKSGYQTVLLENYQAISDRVSTAKIKLTLGNGVKVVVLADKKN